MVSDFKLERDGVSANSGQHWWLHSFILSTNEYKPQQVKIEVFSTEENNRWMEFNLNENNLYKVCLNLSVNEYNGKKYNTIRAWKVINLDEVKENVEAMRPQVQQAPQPVQAQQVSESLQQGKSDDLPF